ncbi:MAG: hypothetical protein IPJ47_13445 [Anaerolineales bacterium]|nr:hypothetical protein [Anaerolineales bacterium]
MILTATHIQFPILQATSTFPPPPPTLALELQDQLYTMLQTNGGCELPCFLGIRPGSTTVSGTKAILETYDFRHEISRYIVAENNNAEWYAANIFTSKDVYLDFHVDVLVANNIVQGLIVGFNAPEKMDRLGREDLTDRHLERYGILELFRRHGIPDDIYITPPHTQDTIAAYGIDVIYNHSQIMGMYSGIAKLDKNGTYELCPSIGDGQVGGFMLIVAAPSIDDMPYFFLSTKVKNFSSSTLDAYRESQKLDTQGIYNLFMKENKRCFYEDQFFVE